MTNQSINADSNDAKDNREHSSPTTTIQPFPPLSTDDDERNLKQESRRCRKLRLTKSSAML
jgi:hypothetical protein